MAGKTFPTFPAHAQPVISRIWQEAHTACACSASSKLTNAEILSIGHRRIVFSEIWIKMQIFSLKWSFRIVVCKIAAIMFRASMYRLPTPPIPQWSRVVIQARWPMANVLSLMASTTTPTPGIRVIPGPPCMAVPYYSVRRVDGGALRRRRVSVRTVMTSCRFLHYWPFVMRIHGSPVDSHHMGPVMRMFDILFIVSI